MKPVTQKDMDVFVQIEENPKENLKTYVSSNVYHKGKGPESWFSTTMTARREMYGAAEIGIAKNAMDNLKAVDSEEDKV